MTTLAQSQRDAATALPAYNSALTLAARVAASGHVVATGLVIRVCELERHLSPVTRRAARNVVLLASNDVARNALLAMFDFIDVSC